MTYILPLISDQHIQALIDNELDREAEERVRHYIRNNAKAQKRYDMLYQQKQLLQDWWHQGHKE